VKAIERQYLYSIEINKLLLYIYVSCAYYSCVCAHELQLLEPQIITTFVQTTLQYSQCLIMDYHGCPKKLTLELVEKRNHAHFFYKKIVLNVLKHFMNWIIKRLPHLWALRPYLWIRLDLLKMPLSRCVLI
jgi:hypothetical protein